MGRDLWLLQTSDRPVVRLYTWSQPAISLGYGQQSDPPNQLPHWLDSDRTVVVRPTGGGYLKHDQDLSYSLILPSGHALTEQSILDLYGKVRDQLESELRHQGWLAESERGRSSTRHEDCLEAPARHEPTVAESKWMGAAQTRNNLGCLQQGSLFWADRDGRTHGLSRPGRSRQDLVEVVRKALLSVLQSPNITSSARTDLNSPVDSNLPNLQVRKPSDLPVLSWKDPE